MAYEETFVLFIGNFLFAAVIGIFVAWFYKRHEKDVSSIRLVVVGAKTAVAGVVFACLLILLLLIILKPAVFKSASATTVQLHDSPGQFAGKNHGFGAILFLNAIIGNIVASFFISLLIPFAVMKNLYGKADGGKPLPNDGTKAQETNPTESPKTNYKI